MCQRLWQRTVGRDDGKEAIIFEDFLKQEYICCLYHVRKKKVYASASPASQPRTAVPADHIMHFPIK